MQFKTKPLISTQIKGLAYETLFEQARKHRGLSELLMECRVLAARKVFGTWNIAIEVPRCDQETFKRMTEVITRGINSKIRDAQVKISRP